MNWFNKIRTNRSLVDKTPIITTFLLELANINQMIRMWSEWTAEGQSLWGWITVNIALILWLNFYLVFNRDNKFAIWGTAVGIFMNSCVIMSVIYFRYLI